ncbi:GntR family transcriptional regulator [Leifsonia aquatica]|uniref:GntR family transcriptional regulator n=1 Tax=Leifsonia aquatica TaxID=144185 RepID=UPI00381FBBE2
MREKLRTAIMDGVLEPGEILRDAELTAWLGVSRTPLRAAIADLERDGLVEMASNQYTRVAVPSDADIVAAMHMMGIMRSGAVDLALPVMGAESILQVQHMCTHLAEQTRTRNLEGMRASFNPMFRMIEEHVSNRFYHATVASNIDGLIFRTRVGVVVAMMGDDGMERFAREAEGLREAFASANVRAVREATEMLHLGWMSE